jgi:hypothetical protein
MTVPTPPKPRIVEPTRAEIINLVAMHYRITTRQAMAVLAEFFDTQLHC